MRVPVFNRGAIDAMTDETAVAGRSLWADARVRFLKNKAAVAGLIVLVCVAVFAAFGQLLTPWSNEEVDWSMLGQVSEVGYPSRPDTPYFGASSNPDERLYPSSESRSDS